MPPPQTLNTYHQSSNPQPETLNFTRFHGGTTTPSLNILYPKPQPLNAGPQIRSRVGSGGHPRIDEQEQETEHGGGFQTWTSSREVSLPKLRVTFGLKLDVNTIKSDPPEQFVQTGRN
jgi:hypothetical protein